MSPHGAAEAVPAPSGEATVVLDIGEGTGALAVRTPAFLDGAELEIRPVGQPWTGTHTGVRRRDLRDGNCFAAVFGSLVEGRYELRVKGSGSGPVIESDVTGGTVTEASWPDG